MREKLYKLVESFGFILVNKDDKLMALKDYDMWVNVGTCNERLQTVGVTDTEIKVFEGNLLTSSVNFNNVTSFEEYVEYMFTEDVSEIEKVHKVMKWI